MNLRRVSGNIPVCKCDRKIQKHYKRTEPKYNPNNFSLQKSAMRIKLVLISLSYIFFSKMSWF